MKKSSVEKVQLAALLKIAAGASNGWSAQHLAMGQPASISQFVRRFRIAGKDRTKKLRDVLSKSRRDSIRLLRSQRRMDRDEALARK